MMKLTFLGTSSGVPTRTRNVSALAVQTALGRGWVLVDCGEGTQHQLLRTRLSVHELAAVCISHVHGDHCYGLPGLLASAAMAGRTQPLTLIAPAPIRQWLQATMAATALHLPYLLDWLELGDAARWQALPGVTITAHAQQHRVPSYAFRFDVQTTVRRLDVAGLRAHGVLQGPLWHALQSGEDVEHAGQTLRATDWTQAHAHRVAAVLGGDNADARLLQQACQGAQLLVHEATYSKAVLEQVGPAHMHSSAHDVAVFAQQAGLPNVLLTHFSPRHHSDEEQAALLQEVHAAYSGHAALAHDFAVFELQASGEMRALPSAYRPKRPPQKP